MGRSDSYRFAMRRLRTATQTVTSLSFLVGYTRLGMWCEGEGIVRTLLTKDRPSRGDIEAVTDFFLLRGRPEDECQIENVEADAVKGMWDRLSRKGQTSTMRMLLLFAHVSGKPNWVLELAPRRFGAPYHLVQLAQVLASAIDLGNRNRLCSLLPRARTGCKYASGRDVLAWLAKLLTKAEPLPEE